MVTCNFCLVELLCGFPYAVCRVGNVIAQKVNYADRTKHDPDSKIENESLHFI
jgi:hypothetical protein